MGDKTKIEWTDATWNPYRSATGKGWHCSKVSEGCQNCYAEAMNKRLGSKRPYQADADRIVLHGPTMGQPLRWTKSRMIFVNSMSDTFHESVSNCDIERLFYVMNDAQRHTFQVLTKRAERMRGWFAASAFARAPLPNVWIGATIENQRQAELRVPLLLKTPAAVRFLSLEPLLEPVVLGLRYMKNRVHWVIVGGESGPKARPIHPDWVGSVRDECAEAGIPFLFKQWGEWVPAFGKVGGGKSCTVSSGTGTSLRMRRVGKKAAGRTLDGREWSEYPNPPHAP